MNFLMAQFSSGLYMACFVYSILLCSKGSYIGYILSCSFSIVTFILLWIMFAFNEEIIAGMRASQEAKK